jgi:hypothetical protein
MEDFSDKHLARYDYTRRAILCLNRAIREFIIPVYKEKYGNEWEHKLKETPYNLSKRQKKERESSSNEPLYLLLSLVYKYSELPKDDPIRSLIGEQKIRGLRSYLEEIKTMRNKWAHPNDNDYILDEDVEVLIDRVQRVIKILDIKPAIEEARQIREEVRREIVRLSGYFQDWEKVDTSLGNSLPSWHKIVQPRSEILQEATHPDFYLPNLLQVKRNEGPKVYKDPHSFFEHTYPTKQLSELLSEAFRRLCGETGKGAFFLHAPPGGGATHSLIALYHLFGETKIYQTEPGLRDLFSNLRVKVPEYHFRRVVLVGSYISKTNPSPLEGKPSIRTFWGHLAWHLGEAAGGPSEANHAYNAIANHDESETPPDPDTLKDLLRKYAPVLILIDEWAAYLLSLSENSLEVYLQFVKNFLEAINQTSGVFLAASLPAQSPSSKASSSLSERLNRLHAIVSQYASPLNPISEEEIAPLLAHRLFEQSVPTDNHHKREEVLKAFLDFYHQNKRELRIDEGSYKLALLRKSYPLHPELIKRLYKNWGVLESFQNIRSLLKLMSAIVRTQWKYGIEAPLIMPGNVAIGQKEIKDELMAHLPPRFEFFLSQEIEGDQAFSAQLQINYPRYKSSQVFQRLARTLFLGAPWTNQSPSLKLSDILLGCIYPDDSIALFKGALDIFYKESHALEKGSDGSYCLRLNIEESK